MTEHFDDLETREPEARERGHFAALPGFLAAAIDGAIGWAAQLGKVDPRAVTNRTALADLPVLRKDMLKERQTATPPFGGFASRARTHRLFISPGPIFEPIANTDAGGAARALFAAGVRAGDIVHNAFAYHLTPGGFIMDAGALALGCAIVPAGTGNSETQIGAITQFKPRAYTGTPDFLKILLDKAAEMGRDITSLQRALVSGAALPASLRQELVARGIAVRQCYASAEAGVIAYESEAQAGMIVNEHVILEIVRPGTGVPVPDGEVGEVVVTVFNPLYPMVRLATGDLSSILPGPSPCGRTGPRIAGWLGRADQVTKVKGMFVHPAQVAQIAARHPVLGRLRLVVTREREQDVMVLRAETAASSPDLTAAVTANLAAILKLRGGVELVAPGTLPNDGKVIADERPVSR